MRSIYLNLILLLPLLVIVSCSEEKEPEKPPAYLLPKEKLVKVLTDLSLAESAANVNPLNLSSARFDSAYAFNPLKENGVSQGLYDSTVRYYSERPELFKEIYEEVLNRLSSMQTDRLQRDSTSLNKKVPEKKP